MNVAFLFSRKELLLLLLILVPVLVYLPVVNYPFVHYDDDMYVTENERVRGGMSWENVRWAMTTMEAAFWHPLTWWSHMLDWEVYGENAGGHHVTNVVLHGVNVVLLYGVLWRMTGGVWSSAMVAGLFGLHPLNVESVAWVAERKNVLSTLFWLMTMWGYVGYVRKGGVWRYGSVLGWFVLGLMAKPMLVTLPCVLLLLDYWPLGRWGEGKERRERWKRLVWEKVPMLGVVGVVSVWAVQAQAKAGALSGLEGLPVGVRLGNAVVAYGEYLRKMVWPMDLAVFYPHAGESLEVWKVMMWGVVLLGITGGVWKWGEKYGYLRVGWLWYVGTLVPVSGLVQVGGHGLADRYAYVPLIGVFVMVVWGMAEIARRRPWSRVWIVLASLLVLAALSVGTRTQLHYWANTKALFYRALQVNSNNHVAHDRIGLELIREGQLDSAIRHLKEAVRIAPEYTEARNNLGLALLEKGELDIAVQHLRLVIATNPSYAPAHSNLGLALVRQGNLDEAIRHHVLATQIAPESRLTHNNLGLALLKKGRRDEAIRHFHRSLEIQPRDPEAYNNLGVALLQKGQKDQAVRFFGEALKRNSAFAEAHYNLGTELLKMGFLARSKEHLHSALETNPRHTAAWVNLAALLRREGDTDGAIECLMKALAVNPRLAEAHNNLGTALAQKGKLEEAMRHFHLALQLNPDYLNARENLQSIQNRRNRR